jgi:transposase
LELTDPGFDSTVLSEFRTRLMKGSAEQVLFDAILEKCREKKLFPVRGRQRTDSTDVLGVIRALNRLECVGQTVRHALNVLALAAPVWLREHSHPEWVDKYGRRVDDYHLPKGAKERQAHAQQIGMDGHALLDRIYATEAPRWLSQLPAIEILRCIWVQQFYRLEGEVRWRTEVEGLPPASLFISSPYDPDARYAKKQTTSWVGYKVHLTETCEAHQPHLITHVETTTAPVADGAVTEKIHEALKKKELLPLCIWWTLDTSMRECWSAVNAITESTYSGLPEMTIIGRQRRGMVSRQVASISIGISSKPPVRKGVGVQVGRQ